MIAPRFAALACLVLPLAACESSMRIPALGSPFGQPQRAAPPPPQVDAAPTPRVQSAPLAPPVTQQDLAPPAGAQTAPVQPPSQPEPTSGAAGGSFGTAGPSEPPKTAKNEPPKTAARPAQNDAPAAPTRSSVTGNWTASEATGGSCRITLSSTPKLDLYNAGTSGCQNKELQKISAWELRDDEVYLYENGGAVAARLKSSGGRFNGALSKTGAPITLSK